MKLPITADFETEAIRDRPQYPPRPVSVAVWEPGRKPEFWAWGHPGTENNCTEAQAKARLREIWRSDRGVLFHEAKFDLDVAEIHLGLRPPPWHRIYDTVFELFLADPNAPGLSLKPAAERVLDWPPEERDTLREWLLAHIKAVKKGKGSGCRANDLLKPSQAFAHVACAPAELVAPYAIGDVRRARALHEALYPHIRGEAYDRERRVLLPLLRTERRGIPIDVEGLEQDVRQGLRLWARLDYWIQKRLKAPELEVGKAEQLADALEDAGLVTEWILTAKDRRSTSYQSLREVCSDRKLVDTLKLRNILRTQIRTFAEPWLKQAQGTGRAFCSFNQVRRAEERRMGKSVGARTGRLSTFPNLQNVPTSQVPIANSEIQWQKIRDQGDALFVPLHRARLPDLRARICAPRGLLLGDHDYSQQELRLLAHFTGGRLAQAYRQNPKTNAHGWVAEIVAPILGKLYPHRIIKNVNFGILYGEGLAHLAQVIECSRDEASKIRRACRGALGAQKLDSELKAAQECTTWGGRLCPVEPVSMVNGVIRDWSYKLINTLIQGSAGDQVKEAMILFDESNEIEAEMLLSVHDEILWQAPSKIARSQVRPIREVMESLELSVPLIATGKVGRTWRSCK
jgi:DNA polymerase I-like protein with 3'-5' exonuclease and polymerase domains